MLQKINYSRKNLLKFGSQIDFSKCLAIHIVRAKQEFFENSANSRSNILSLISIGIKNFGILLITGFKIEHSTISRKPAKYLLVQSFSDNYLTSRVEMLTLRFDNLSKLTIYNDRVLKIDLFAIFLTLYILISRRQHLNAAINMTHLKKSKTTYFYLLSIIFVGLSDAIKLFEDLKRYEVIITAQEMLTSENLICQLANHLGLNTFALVHGLGQIEHDENGPTKSGLSSYVFKAFYSSTVCRTVLGWGEYHVNIYRLSGAKDVLSVGMPGHLEAPSVVEDGVTFVFDSDDYENSKLLRIENEIRLHGIQTSLWPKPGTKLYKELGGARIGPARKFIVGLKSTMLAEFGILNFRVYLTGSRFFPSSVFREVFVNNAADLLTKIAAEAPYPFDVWKYLIASHGEESANILTSVIKLHQQRRPDPFGAM